MESRFIFSYLGFMQRFGGIWIEFFVLFLFVFFDVALRFPNLFYLFIYFFRTPRDAGCCPIAASSTRAVIGGPAHRHLAPLRAADWRQSVATPPPRANGEAKHRESRARAELLSRWFFWVFLKPDFFYFFFYNLDLLGF